MDLIAECTEQRARLRVIDAGTKYYAADAHGWQMEVRFIDNNDVGDSLILTSVVEVDAFIGAHCPACRRVDRRRTRGGRCRACVVGGRGA